MPTVFRKDIGNSKDAGTNPYPVRSVCAPARPAYALTSAPDRQRIDKWLWHARFCKTRSVAHEKAAQGQIRLNGHRVEKPSIAVHIGDVMTLTSGGRVISVRVLGLGLRRGPAAEAKTLYDIIGD